MKKIVHGLAVTAIACTLALFAGCGSSSPTSSAASSDANASAATSSASAQTSASESSAAAVAAPIDPANLADGEYTIDVTLQGGSGKATVDSPTKLTVKGGAMQAVIVWSSPNYDQMIVDGEQYLPVPRTGNSTFEIPVSALDEDLPIQAETTAMSEPHMIDYTLHFDSSSLQAA